MVVVMVNEGADLPFQVAGKEVVFKQDAVLHRLMAALDLPLGLRVVRCAANVIHMGRAGYLILRPPHTRSCFF